ncbi:MAG: DUF5329 domain-containing protein [Desulfopila sp.]|jgi:hypothetical protein|nr:DUF5329 domain-containing protein [Desulfopila sp.]
MKNRKVLQSLSVALATVIFCFQVPVIAKGDTAVHEIGQLIAFIKTSECRFNRNGSWYDPAEAADHLNRKYQYIQKKGLVSTAEDFITIAATKSSFSGKEYVVQCAGEKPRKSAAWLTDALAQQRKMQVKNRRE